MTSEEMEQADRERLEKLTMKEIRAIAKEESMVLRGEETRKANAINAIVEWRRFKGRYMEHY